MLCCDKTVTLVSCDGEDYTLTAITGVSWFEKLKIIPGDKGILSANTIKLRIPAERIPHGITVRTGDTLVLGTISAKIQKPSDLIPYRSAKIMGVSDNLRGSLPHLMVTCA